MLLYILLLFTLSISLPPVSLSSACPSHLMIITVVTVKVPIHITPLCDHHPYFLVHSCKYHPLQQLYNWDLQCIPISFSLCIISFKLSHSSLDSMVNHYNHSDSMVNRYNHSHALFLSDIFFLEKYQLWLIPTLHIPYIFTQAVYVWRKTNHAVYYLKWALSSA